MDEWKRIRFLIKGGDAILAAIPEAIADMLPLAPEDADILSRLDGYKTIGPAGHRDCGCPSSRPNKLLFDLLREGHVTIISPGAGWATPASSSSAPGTGGGSRS